MKQKPHKVEQHATKCGHAATIEHMRTPWLLVPEKFTVQIFSKEKASEVIHRRRTNCQPSALAIINDWQPNN